MLPEGFAFAVGGSRYGIPRQRGVFHRSGIMQKAQLQETLERAEKRRAREILRSARGTVRR